MLLTSRDIAYTVNIDASIYGGVGVYCFHGLGLCQEGKRFVMQSHVSVGWAFLLIYIDPFRDSLVSDPETVK